MDIFGPLDKGQSQPYGTVIWAASPIILEDERRT